jgi:hypothetical protein
MKTYAIDEAVTLFSRAERSGKLRITSRSICDDGIAIALPDQRGVITWREGKATLRIESNSPEDAAS